MAEANTEDGHPAGERANTFLRVRDWFGVAGTIREKNSVWAERQNIFRGSAGWNNGDVAVVVDQQPQNVLLDAEVVRYDLELLAVLRAGAGFAHLLGPWRSGKLN